jgi:heptosyltransferase-2
MNMAELLRSVDKYIGNIIVGIIYLLFKYKNDNPNSISNNKNYKNVLVIRLWTLGESTLTLPMIKKLKDNGYNITVLVTNRSIQVFKNVDFIDEIINLKEYYKILKYFKKYDIVIDTEPYLNISAILGWFLGKNISGFKGLYRDKIYDFKIKYNDKIHVVYNFCNLLKPFGIEYEPKKLEPLTYSQNDKKNVDNLLKKYNINDKNLVGIHCSIAETAPIWRSWKKEKFAKLIEKLVEDGYYVILTGTKNDHKINEEVLSYVDRKYNNKTFNFAGETNLRELAYLLTKFKVYISNDTGVLHLSAAMGTKTIGLYGPDLPERYAPFGNGNIAIYKAKDLSCSPCTNSHKGEFGGFKCKLKGKCMDTLS